MSLWKAYKYFWKNYLNFSGKSNRVVYWKSFLINWSIRLILGLLMALSFLGVLSINLYIVGGLLLIYCLIAFLPSISMTARRYKDATLTPWLMVITYLLPVILKFTTRYCPTSPSGHLLLYMFGNLASLLIFICLVLAVILPIFPSRKRK